MSEPRALTKSELNERFYGAVDPETAFGTEVQVGFHQIAVARLVSSLAAGLEKRGLRVLELGASTCLFAEAFLQALGHLVSIGESELERLEYTAVDFSEPALEAALRGLEHRPGFDRVEFLSAPPPEEDLVTLARLRRREAIETELALVRAEANRFASGAAGPYDVVLLNELLDDLPWRLFWAGADGTPCELTAYAQQDGSRWRVRLVAREPEPGAVPTGLRPGTLAATSPESERLLRRAVELLEPGGLLLVHDYGFTEPFAAVRQYADPQRELPPFVEVEAPDGPDVPRSFFRVYGNEAAGEIQITSDVAFAELASVLEPTGRVVAIPHGNTLVQSREWPDIFEKGDGVFLSEFMLHATDDDLPALLESLAAGAQDAKERYSSLLGEGRTSMLTDLIYLKA